MNEKNGIRDAMPRYPMGEEMRRIFGSGNLLEE